MKLADQVRQHEGVRIVRAHERAALFGEIRFVRLFVDGEKQLFLQRIDLLLGVSLMKLQLRLVDHARVFRISIMRSSCLLRG